MADMADFANESSQWWDDDYDEWVEPAHYHHPSTKPQRMTAREEKEALIDMIENGFH